MLDLQFADSFAHYDNAGIPLKWDSAGGSIETGSTHLRMGGPQSLRIQAGDSPTKNLYGGGHTVIGFAWQTEVLSGEVIFEQWAIASIDPAPPERQLFLIQNADGSISLWSGNDPTPTLITTSAPGVLTVDTWWYIELSSYLGSYGAPDCAVKVTVTDATGNAVEIINVSGFATTQFQWDTFLWGGPTTPYHAWIDSFYFQAFWDGEGDPTVVLGAPKIYGQCIPISDGVGYISFNPTQPGAFIDGPSAPWFPQVNEIPQDTSTFIEQDEVIEDGVEAGWPFAGRSFKVDVSAIPPGSPIAALQTVILYSSMGGEAGPFPGEYGAMVRYTGQPDNWFQSRGGRGAPYGFPYVIDPYRFSEFGYMLNPITNLPWDLTEFTGSAALQFGPWLPEPS